MRILGDSVRLRYLQQLGQEVEFPEDYYQGHYIINIAQQLKKEFGDKLKIEQKLDRFTAMAEEEVFKDIKNTISRLNFKMDVFYNEKSL